MLTNVPAWRLTMSVVALVLTAAQAAAGGPAGASNGGERGFRVTFDRDVRETPASGRLVVYLVKANSPVDLAGEAPGSGPFFESPQPMFGVDVVDLAPGKSTDVGERATAFPVALAELPPGRYKVQAVLDMHRQDSSWRREPGNLFSKTQIIEVKKGRSEVFDVALTEVVRAEDPPASRGVEYVEVPSPLLTAFRGTPVTLRAGVVLPSGYQPGQGGRKYAAVYEVPGFGGDHHGARRAAMMVRGGAAGADLMKECFWIVLNPEGPNGHHLFANSDNNGPVGDALVHELIPELERRYPLIAQASARIVRGHSSGGWSSVWLPLAYPETFGAAWSSSPDPVDFVHFQLPDIYSDPNMFTRPPAPGAGGTGKPTEVPSFRDTGDTRMTIREENQMEEVLGPKNTSGQQWDSWLAAFGPKDADGNPAALYDPRTGALDKGVAATYRRYDVADLLRRDPEKYGPIFKQRIRIICGEEDNYFLNEAVASLKAELAKLDRLRLPEGEHGYVKLVPGRDHSTIYATQEMRAVPVEMLEHLRRAGHVR